MDDTDEALRYDSGMVWVELRYAVGMLVGVVASLAVVVWLILTRAGGVGVVALIALVAGWIYGAQVGAKLNGGRKAVYAPVILDIFVFAGICMTMGVELFEMAHGTMRPTPQALLVALGTPSLMIVVMLRSPKTSIRQFLAYRRFRSTRASLAENGLLPYDR